MNRLFTTGRIFFGLAMTATGVQQLFFRQFFQILFPPLPYDLPWLIFVAYAVALFLIIAGVSIIFNIRTGLFSSLLGFLFLFFFICFYVPYELWIQPYNPIHLGLWINALKELAYSGGAFFLASQSSGSASRQLTAPEKFTSRYGALGRFMFSFTMISFGVSHFYYTETVQNMVPNWIPFHVFWTIFAGLALIAAGLSIVFNWQRRLMASLLGLMIFLWFIVLHMPGAIARPVADNGNEVTSAFSALAFSGIALMIANAKSKQAVAE